jgi:hypothetical protein
MVELPLFLCRIPEHHGENNWKSYKAAFAQNAAEACAKECNGDGHLTVQGAHVEVLVKQAYGEPFVRKFVVTREIVVDYTAVEVKNNG